MTIFRRIWSHLTSGQRDDAYEVCTKPGYPKERRRRITACRFELQESGDLKFYDEAGQVCEVIAASEWDYVEHRRELYTDARRNVLLGTRIQHRVLPGGPTDVNK